MKQIDQVLPVYFLNKHCGVLNRKLLYLNPHDLLAHLLLFVLGDFSGDVGSHDLRQALHRLIHLYLQILAFYKKRQMK